MTITALLTLMSFIWMTDTCSSPGLKSSLPCRDLVISKNLLMNLICLLLNFSTHSRVKISMKAEAGVQVADAPISGFSHHYKTISWGAEHAAFQLLRTANNSYFEMQKLLWVMFLVPSALWRVLIIHQEMYRKPLKSYRLPGYCPVLFSLPPQPFWTNPVPSCATG